MSEAQSMYAVARDEIDHGYRHDAILPEGYVRQVIELLESGNITEVADDWARQTNEYVYTYNHFDVEAEYRYTDEWQEAERHAAKLVSARDGVAGRHGGPELLQLVARLRAETVALFLADVYTTAVWDWLHLIRVESPAANEYLNDQAELAMAGVRDTPHFD